MPETPKSIYHWWSIGLRNMRRQFMCINPARSGLALECIASAGRYFEPANDGRYE